jgi:hypothetical protein
MNRDDLVNMKLHETKKIGLYTEVLRVEFGWIYTIHSSDRESVNRPTSVLVPDYLEISINCNINVDARLNG